MFGGNHIHSRVVASKLEGEREITLSFVDLLREDFIEKQSKSQYLFHSRLGLSTRCSTNGL